MKKFKVWARYSTYCFLDVEAETKEEAEEIAGQTDGGDFEQQQDNDYDGSGGWEIVDTMTTEVEE